MSSMAAQAEPGSRLWATGGVTTIEGSAGGGLVPMAVLSGYASDTEWGGSVALSHAPVDDYTLDVMAASLNYRFSAARAYCRIVQARLIELREERVEGLQTITEFMERRLAPAMRTCQNIGDRLEVLSKRVARANNLLRTRVDILLEAQNRDLLASMDRRVKLQLRLQQTVEGLSVAAITYYAVGLLGYLFKALKDAGVPVNDRMATGLAVPVVLAAIWISMRRIRKTLHRADT